jgi:hypothetical protein
LYYQILASELSRQKPFHFVLSMKNACACTVDQSKPYSITSAPRTLIEEIIVDIDQAANQVVMLIHWSGGRHTELRITKPKTGEHNHKTATEAVEIVRQMAGQYPDDVIASTLEPAGGW